MSKLSPVFNDTQLDNSGNLLVGGLIYTYAAGSTTPLATYTSSSSAVAQANPIVLNARGEVASPIWLTEGLLYKLRLFDSSNNFIREFDNVAGVGDTSITVEQWIVSGITPTYVSATQFTLPGDQTSAFQVGRRVKATVTAGTVYGTISVSAFAALTTVTLIMDAGQVLDSGLSAVSYGIITPTSTSLPFSLSAGSIQSQQFTAYPTTGGTTAFVATPFPALATYTNARLALTINATPTGSPTMNWSGLGAKNWKYYDAAGAKQFVTSTQVLSGMITDNWYDGTDVVLLNPVIAVGRRLAQVQTTQVGTVATGTTLIPFDNTIPQITEGDQYMTLAITPQNALSTLEIDVTFIGTSSAAGNPALTVALFQDATANALAASSNFVAAANFLVAQTFKYIVTAGTTSATTFRVRAGGSAAGTTTFNGTAGAQFLGGVMSSRITIKEYLP